MLIPTSDISTLKTADEVKQVASTALLELELEAVARLINLAANTGETRAVWEHPMHDNTLNLLRGKNYKVYKSERAAERNFSWIIDWS